MITLNVTPGVTWTAATVANPTNLNATATPQVTLLDDGSITPAYLDMDALSAALSDTVRSRNYLRRSNFFWEDWKQPLGVTCPVGVFTENALEWWARPTGSTVTVARNELAPNDASTWAAKITGSLGNMGVQYATWVPSAVGGSLGNANIVFSLYVFNHTGAAFTANAIMIPATTPNERATALVPLTGASTTCAAGVWTRVDVSFAGSAYDLQYGFYVGVSVGALAATASLSVAQAQLEIAASPSPFIRPVLNPDSLSNIPVMSEAERVNGAMMVVRMGNGELRLLPAPGSLLSPAVIGYNANVGVPEWIDVDGSIMVLRYTGADQIFTVPAAVTSMEIHCWGAGAASNNGRPGGVGGYTRGRFTVTAGTQFSAMVGGPGIFLSSVGAYGFGGIGGPQGGGGGLTGVFTSTTPILFTDAARALVIAGGGGAVFYNYNSSGSPVQGGGNGNETTNSGGQTDFRGIGSVGIVGYTAGGGGYFGGSYISLTGPGKGGSGFKAASATAFDIIGQTRLATVAVDQLLVVPQSGIPYYQASAGQPNYPGLIVIVWNP